MGPGGGQTPRPTSWGAAPPNDHKVCILGGGWMSGIERRLQMGTGSHAGRLRAAFGGSGTPLLSPHRLPCAPALISCSNGPTVIRDTPSPGYPQMHYGKNRLRSPPRDRVLERPSLSPGYLRVKFCPRSLQPTEGGVPRVFTLMDTAWEQKGSRWPGPWHAAPPPALRSVPQGVWGPRGHPRHSGQPRGACGHREVGS